MTKYFLLLVWMLVLIAADAQEFTSIHQEQQELYNAENKTTQWYEQNVNTKKFFQAEERTSCNLEKVVYGWHPYWVGSAYNNYDWGLLSHLSFFSYEVDETNGEALTTHGWATSDAVDSALVNGTKVTLCVTLFGGSDLSTFLSNPASQQTLITNLISLVQSRGAHGVNIDFEGLPSSQKINFANFMVDLSDQMHTAIPASEVSTVLYAVDWNDVFDFTIMASAVDHFIVMGYAYYYQGSSSTGPCDPLYHYGSSYNYNLSKTTTYYLDKGCPKDKFVLGLPYYGYEWETTNMTVPSPTEANGVARTFAYVKNNTSGNYSAGNYTWDDDSYTDIFAFNNGVNKQCFVALEDAFEKRLDFVNQSGIAGIGIWALGYDNGYTELWDALDSKFTDCKVDPCAGIIHDFGGPTKNYYNDEDYTWTLSPDGANSIDVDFTMFDVEVNYDTLFIYDGTSITDPLIGAYTGTDSPGTFSTSTGSITFYWKSDGATVAAGWLADYVCNTTTTNPQPNFSLPANNTFCQGELIQFTNTSTASTNYYWEFESGLPASSTDQDPEVSYMSSGTYDVTLNAIDGIDTNSYVQQVSVQVAAAPLASFTSNSPVYMPNSAIYFTNGSANASVYQWSFGDGNISSDANPWNSYAIEGTYTVQLISANYICPNDTSSIVVEVINTVGLFENSTLQFSVYPNPFTDIIYVDGLMLEGAADVKIYSAEGKLVYQKANVTIESNELENFNSLSSGNYIIEIHQGDFNEKFRLVKK
jgi:spore germination protein YaaH